MPLDVACLSKAQVAFAIRGDDRPSEHLDIVSQASDLCVVIFPQMLPEQSTISHRKMARGLAEQFHTMSLCFMAEPGIDGVEEVVGEMAVRVSTDIWLEV